MPSKSNLDGIIDIGLLNRDDLSHETKLYIVDEHERRRFQLPDTHCFPKNSQGRRYNSAWEKQYNWIRYSVDQDGVYCSVCFAFASLEGAVNGNTEFVSMPFRDWKNACGEKRGAFPKHTHSNSHQTMLERADNFISVSKQTTPSIQQSISDTYRRKIEQNRAALLSIIDIIVTLGRRGISLRGTWDKTISKEDGNFLHFVDWKSRFDQTLDLHLRTAPKNARYLSPTIQNEFIDLVGRQIRQKIVGLCNRSKFISIMADETTDSSGKEQLSICARYVMPTMLGRYEVCEDFLGFVELDKTDAKTITDALITNLQIWEVNLNRWRGKGFDGAATMSSSLNGVQARIMHLFPMAKYFTHCSSHCLNLVVVASCKAVPSVQNFMTSFRDLTFFFVGSAKRKAILRSELTGQNSLDILGDIDDDDERSLFECGARHNVLPTLSETRWLSRVDSITALLANYCEVHDALIKVRDQSNGQSAHDAQSKLIAMTQFPFIMSAVLCQFVLGFIRPLSVSLQSVTCDLLAAHADAQNLIRVLQSVRNANNDVDKFDKLFDRAKSVAEAVHVDVSKPRTCTKQQHRSNISASDAREYYRLNFYLPFLDHVIQHLRQRFPPELAHTLLGYYLVPGNLHKLTSEIEESLRDVYSNDLPFPADLDAEILRWREKNKTGDNPTTSLIEAVNNCNVSFYPNISSIFHLLLTLPVGSCSCERSFSKLRRLKDYTRTSMTDTRLNGLALSYIHHDVVVDPLDVLKSWDSSMERRISLAFSE